MFSYLESYIQFKSVKEMDQHIAEHLKNDLTKAERAVFLAMGGRALNYPGVCHLKAQTIAEVCEISTKTVYRAVKRLTALQMIRKIPSTKMNGIKGANIYVILPYVPSKMSERATDEKTRHTNEKAELPEKQPISFNQNHCKYINKENNSSKLSYRQLLIDLFESMPFDEQYIGQIKQLSMVISVNTLAEFDRAKRVLFKLLMLVQSGELKVKTNLCALFKGAYEKWIFWEDEKDNVQEESIPLYASTCTVPFYNWLEERE